jgi:hypothetical protein
MMATVMMMLVTMLMLTFRECKCIVAILEASDGIERTILPCQAVCCGFLNDHGATLCNRLKADRGCFDANCRRPQGFVGRVSRVHEQLLGGTTSENSMLVAFV